MYSTCDMSFVFYYALARESTTFVVLRHSCTFLHCIYLHYWSYTSLRLMLFVVKTTWNKAYSILFLFYTGRQVLERASNWNGVQNTNLHLAYLRNSAEIKSMPSRLIGPWRPYDCDVTHTCEMGPFKLLSLPFSADLLLLFDSVI